VPEVQKYILEKRREGKHKEGVWLQYVYGRFKIEQHSRVQ